MKINIGLFHNNKLLVTEHDLETVIKLIFLKISGAEFYERSISVFDCSLNDENGMVTFVVKHHNKCLSESFHISDIEAMGISFTPDAIDRMRRTRSEKAARKRDRYRSERIPVYSCAGKTWCERKRTEHLHLRLDGATNDEYGFEEFDSALGRAVAELRKNDEERKTKRIENIRATREKKALRLEKLREGSSVAAAESVR